MRLAAMALGSSGLCRLVRVHLSGNATALSAMASAMSKRKSNMWHISEVKVTQVSPTLCDPINMEFFQARILQWLPFPSPGALPNPGIESRCPALQVDSLPAEPQGKPKNTGVGSLSLLQWIFLTQEPNQGLLHVTYKGSRNFIWWSIHPYSFPLYWV